jgi:uncharacterized repeat protein (TIGR03803 family)
MAARCFGRSLTRLPAVGAALVVCLTASTVHAVTLTTLVSFGGDNGGRPRTGLVSDIRGNLYGTTSLGGASGLGTVFKFDPVAGQLTTLASFEGFNGDAPYGDLIIDAIGNLYGTTSFGGTEGQGTVFKIDHTSGVLTTLVSFGVSNGIGPRAGLTADSAGNLYGTTAWGGANSLGTVFKLDLTSGELTTLVSFDGGNGSVPYSGLTADAAGNLYGTTRFGGMNDSGTVFKLDPATGELTTLVSFNGVNGRVSWAGLTTDVDGKLYGTTNFGGANDFGTVFKIDTTSGELTTLVSFDGDNSRYPYAGLITDAAGNLYGTTHGVGGPNFDRGSVFKIDAVTGVLTTLVSFPFNAANGHGRNPHAGLLADAAGNLYGTTYDSGVDTLGTIFKLSDTGFVVFVPEPGAGLLATLAFVTVATRRRRKSSTRS